LELIYTNAKIEEQCTSLKAARMCFGGNNILATSLLARINALKQADTIKDIIVQPSFHFHDLKNKDGKNYKDASSMDSEQKQYIANACQLGIM
jgi:plasmid maintenance system killer protein